MTMLQSRSRFLFALLGALLTCSLRLVAVEHAQVTLLVTTDVHGRVLPYDYFTQKPAQVGLAKIATVIKQIRSRHPEALVIDCGDTIQGTPLAYHHNRRNNTPIDPMMRVMNGLGYTAMTIGNHEFNFGLQVLEKARGEASFPWLSANTYHEGTQKNAFPPYVVKVVSGVRVGILGLTTPEIPTWENPEHYAGLEFRETVSEARKRVRVLRETEQVDLVVGAFHMGLEENLATGARNGSLPRENACLTIAREVQGIDVIFMGHTHQDVPSLVVDGVLLAQAGRWGDHLVRADVYLSRKPGEGWKVTAKGSESLPMNDSIAADTEVLSWIQTYHAETELWLSEVIGDSGQTLNAGNATFEDNAVIDLIHKVQLEAGEADVSMAAVFNPRASIPKGPVTVREPLRL